MAATETEYLNFHDIQFVVWFKFELKIKIEIITSL